MDISDGMPSHLLELRNVQSALDSGDQFYWSRTVETGDDDFSLFWQGVGLALKEKGVHVVPRWASIGDKGRVRALVPATPWRRHMGACIILDKQEKQFFVSSVRKKILGSHPGTRWVSVVWEDNDEFINDLVKAAVAFYEAVVNRTHPVL